MRYQDIQWEDEDSGFEDKKKPSPEKEASFEELLAEDADQNSDEVDIRVGRQVSGTVTNISTHSDTVLVSIDALHTAVMDKNQIINDKGEFEYHVGDKIVAYVISRTEDEILLSRRMGQSKNPLEDLIMARNGQLPVKGKVTGENKGGFEVTIMGKRAFCPVSQIDSKFVSNKAEYMGKEFDFLIEKVEEGGRNVVVSRSKLLKKESEAKIVELEARLDREVIMDGEVREVKDFGAFVDLGGFDGFLHVSEISYARINRAGEFLNKGDKVRVKVLRVETTDDGKKRISLSMKAIQEDPWASIGTKYEAGKSYPGTVTRLETFGAFVSLEPGVEGLMHISEMSWEKRIHHPSEVVKVGDTVNVRLLDIKPADQKLSLSLKNIEEDPWANAEAKFASGTQFTGTVQSLKGFGAFVEIAPGIVGLVPTEILKKAHGESYKKKASPPQELNVVVRELNLSERKILLSLPEIKDDTDDIAAYHEYMQSQDSKTSTKAAAPQNRGTFGDLLLAKLEKAKTK
ncbi:MAG: S1 RNA-binding domain-containing protein [Proteobacteria bacterium]|nr:MAG: S1 RNA-binding domain-containing protein [Pseudomonadota bacterium]